MSPMRFCQDCIAEGRPPLFDRDATGTMRCPRHQAEATRRRNARPSSSARGLGWAFTRRKQADPAYQAATRCQCPGCPACGDGCGRPFTPANPKTGDHLIPRSQGGAQGPIRALCRRCNSSRGGAISGQPGAARGS